MSKVLFTFIESIWWLSFSELEKKTQKVCAKINNYLKYVFVIVVVGLAVALFISYHLCIYHIPVSTFHGISKENVILQKSKLV